jgi:N-acetylmuramoyl-L-alanine amidase
MPRCPRFNETKTDSLSWVYPQQNAVIYEASTFVLGSVAKTVHTLKLNGAEIPLYFNESENAFAHVILLNEGENFLELVTDTGEALTRQVIRQSPWRFSEESSTPLYAVLPEVSRVPRYLIGQSFSVELRAMPHIQQVWLNLITEDGQLICELPLHCDDAFLLNPKRPTHGKQVSMFGQLHYDADHPPIDKRVQVFHGVVALTHPLLFHLPDSHQLQLQYKVVNDQGHVSRVNLGQRVCLWQFQRMVEVTASCQSFYAGTSANAQRLALMPPLHSHLPVVGLWDVDAFLIPSNGAFPYLLKGGKPLPQTGKPKPAVLDALSLEEQEDQLTSTFLLTHPCGVTLQPKAHGLDVSLLPIEAGLNHQRYLQTALRWEITPEGEGLRLHLPVEWPRYKGVESHWNEEGLSLTLLKLPPEKKAWRILIDAGHGGKEDGTCALNGTLEKTWTLELAQRIKRLLEEAGVEHVFLTRNEDMSLGLRERQQLAEELHVDLCLSVHANALPDGQDPTARTGVSVHTYTPWSEKVGDALLDSLAQVQGNDGRYVSNYAMTRLPRCISVLVEYGYFIHPQAYVHLLEEERLWQLAHATVHGLLHA